MLFSRVRRALASAVLSLCVAGVGLAPASGAANPSAGSGKHVVIMPPNITLSELTSGGVELPRADWTNTAQRLVLVGFTSALARQSVSATQADALTDPHDIQLSHLNATVGFEILLHVYFGVKLPTKTAATDWTLGPGVQTLRDRYHADTALFVSVFDTYSSQGGSMPQVQGEHGFDAQTGRQAAFITMVDLNTGNIVWFNCLTTRFGDLRDPQGADGFVNSILKGNPL